MTEPSATTTSSEISPTASDEEILCPLCEYNLRGLPEPRCPECGHRSTWEELRDRQAQHPYLFEYYPRRNIWSFLRTLLGSLLPRRFWKRLVPTMTARPRRLYWFAVSAVVLGLLGIVLSLGGQLVQQVRRTSLQKQASIAYGKRELARQPGDPFYNASRVAQLQGFVRRYGSLEAFYAMQSPSIMSSAFWQEFWKVNGVDQWQARSLKRPVEIILLWMPLTVATLMIFRASLRQARIKVIHVIRCVIYSGSILALMGLILLIAMALMPPQSFGSYVGYSNFRRQTTLGYVDDMYFASALVLPILAYRLAIAYRRYLRFPHANLTVLASQVIVILVLIRIDLLLQGM